MFKVKKWFEKIEVIRKLYIKDLCVFFDNTIRYCGFKDFRNDLDKTSQNFNITFRVFSGKCTSIVGRLKPFCSFFVSLMSFFKRYITERRKQCFNLLEHDLKMFLFFISSASWNSTDFEQGFGLSLGLSFYRLLNLPVKW